eukprot:591919-Amphidinium_carterae.1
MRCNPDFLSCRPAASASAFEPPLATGSGLPPLQCKRPMQTGKGAGKKQQKPTQPSMPAGLQGGVPRLADDTPI